jgi:hypothetical protein
MREAIIQEMILARGRGVVHTALLTDWLTLTLLTLSPLYAGFFASAHHNNCYD